MRTPIEDLQLQLDTRFVRDAGGRLLRKNERSNVNTIPPAPLVFFGRTPLGNVWACSAGLPERLRREVEQHLAAEPVLATYEAPPTCRELLYTLLAEHEPVRDEEAGPAFTFAADIPVPAGVVPVTSANSHRYSPVQKSARKTIPDTIAPTERGYHMTPLGLISRDTP
jgi:hypothetical protein